MANQLPIKAEFERRIMIRMRVLESKTLDRMLELLRQDPELLSQQYEFGKTGLQLVVQMTDLETLDAVLGLAPVEAAEAMVMRDEDGITPMQWCAEFGQIEKAQKLVEVGGPGQLEIFDNNHNTPLMKAIKWINRRTGEVGHEGMVQFLVAQGAQTDGMKAIALTSRAVGSVVAALPS